MIIATAIVRVCIDWSPQCEALRGELEVRRKHTDDGEFRIVGRSPNGLADGGGIAAELLLPATVAEYGNGVASRAIFFRCEQASQERLNAEHGKEVGCSASTL